MVVELKNALRLKIALNQHFFNREYRVEGLTYTRSTLELIAPIIDFLDAFMSIRSTLEALHPFPVILITNTLQRFIEFGTSFDITAPLRVANVIFKGKSFFLGLHLWFTAFF